MRIMLAAVAVATLGACASQTGPKIMADQFYPHKRFAAQDRERSFSECRLGAVEAGQRVMASGVPGALPTLYGPPPLAVQAVREHMALCMDSKGYAWTQGG